jgi:hypothetical protein
LMLHQQFCMQQLRLREMTMKARLTPLLVAAAETRWVTASSPERHSLIPVSREVKR